MLPSFLPAAAGETVFRVGVVGSTRAYKPWSTPTASSRSGSQERRLAVFSHQAPCNRRVACEAAASHGEDRHSRPASPRRRSGPLRSRAEPGCADSPRSFAREGLPPRVPAGTPRRRPDVLRSCAVLLPALPRTRQRAMSCALLPPWDGRRYGMTGMRVGVGVGRGTGNMRGCGGRPGG